MKKLKNKDLLMILAQSILILSCSSQIETETTFHEPAQSGNYEQQSENPKVDSGTDKPESEKNPREQKKYNLTAIGNNAFAGTAIEKIEFPDSVRKFGKNIMSTSTKEVLIRSKVIDKMDNQAFFTMSDPSIIRFENQNLYKGNTYNKGGFGSWGPYWYGHTRTKIAGAYDTFIDMTKNFLEPSGNGYTINIDNQASINSLLNNDGTLNQNLLQKALDTFDFENSIEPYIILSAQTSNINQQNHTASQKWTLTYGKAAGSLAGQKYDRTFSNGFDALNEACSLVPSGNIWNEYRKSRIRIDSDMYAGKQSSSVQSSNKDISGLYSVRLHNNTIIDFTNHTMYLTEEENKSIVPFAIKNRSYVSIRNIKFYGHARYTIWVLGSNNLVFDNISFEMDNQSGLGLRIAENNNTWSTNIFADNISVNGIQDQAFETMKVDGIWIGTVKATNCNDCGLLLNTTTNAAIKNVDGTRCSPRSGKGVYAAFRTANYVGPNIHAGKIKATECGRGYFSVSANAGIEIDELESFYSYSNAILIQDTQELLIHRALLKGGCNNSSNAVRLASGSAGGSLPVTNNTFMNMKIENYSQAFKEDEGSGGFNRYIKCSTQGSSFGNSTSRVLDAEEVKYDYTIIIPEGTKEIASGAYQNYVNITSVKIPSSVTKIGDNAFYGCKSLRTVIFEGE